MNSALRSLKFTRLFIHSTSKSLSSVAASPWFTLKREMSATTGDAQNAFPISPDAVTHDAYNHRFVLKLGPHGEKGGCSKVWNADRKVSPGRLTEFRFIWDTSRSSSTSTDEAIIDYQELDDKTWDMFHTFSPPQHRGKGAAEAVTTKAIQIAKEEGKKVVASCWYVKGYLDKNPEIAKEVEASR